MRHSSDTVSMLAIFFLGICLGLVGFAWIEREGVMGGAENFFQHGATLIGAAVGAIITILGIEWTRIRQRQRELDGIVLRITPLLGEIYFRLDQARIIMDRIETDSQVSNASERAATEVRLAKEEMLNVLPLLEHFPDVSATGFGLEKQLRKLQGWVKTQPDVQIFARPFFQGDIQSAINLTKRLAFELGIITDLKEFLPPRGSLSD